MSQELHLIVRRAKKTQELKKKTLKLGQICELNIRNKRLTVEQITR